MFLFKITHSGDFYHLSQYTTVNVVETPNKL